MDIQTVNIAYHYMSVDTFCKMLDGSSDKKGINFHASYICSMNDPTEFRYGFGKVMDLLPSIENNLSVSNENRLSKSLSAKTVKDDFLNQLTDNFRLPFVICFSNHKDFLPQWKMYGDHCHGISLGFDIQNYYKVYNDNGKKLLDMTHYDDDEIRALRVSYKRVSKRHRLVMSIELLYKNYIQDIPGKDSSEVEKLKWHYLYNMAFYLSALIKHKSYSYESETRILYPCSRRSDIKFKQNSQGSIIPYTNVLIDAERLKKIVIGPLCDFQATKLMIETRLFQLGVRNVKILKSAIPFR